MKKIFGVLLSLLLVICGCSCDGSSFSINKLELFANANIKTYDMIYKKYMNGSLLTQVNVVSKCNKKFCEYYVKKVYSNNTQESWYKYNESNYILKIKKNGVFQPDSQVALTTDDSSFDFNIGTLINFVNNDVGYYKKKNENFTYKVEEKKYITEFKHYSSDEKLKEKSINTYSFNKKNYIDKFTEEKEIYSTNNGDVVSIEKVEIEVLYDGVILPSF